MKAATHIPDPLPHKAAPKDSPDDYITTETVTFVWHKVPKRWVKATAVGRYVHLHPYSEEAVVFHHGVDDSTGAHYFELTIPAPFYFAVSLAPSFLRSRPGACLHDCLYQISDRLHKMLGISLHDFLEMSDDWFHIQMESTGFLLADTYYEVVHTFGYFFHRVTNVLKFWKTDK